MASDLSQHPAFGHTQQRLASVKRMNPQGNDYWLAREIHLILGYPAWDKFLPVIERAEAAFRGNGVDPSQHIAQTSKMLKVGSGATRRGVDYFLSRSACDLIAMNGDPSKPEVAGAQAYFAIQTRMAEEFERAARDQARIAGRDRVKKSLSAVTDVAKDAGVTRYDWFHAARYHGLYGASVQEVHKMKGLDSTERLLDRAGPLELSAHEFQSNLAKEKILNDNISGQEAAIAANREVAEDVRDLIIQKAGVKLEDVPLEPESIHAVEKRQRDRLKKIPGSSA